MKTLRRTLLMAIAMLLCSTTVSAHDLEVDGIYYNITSDTDLTVGVTYKGSGLISAVYSGIVVIPESIAYNGVSYDVASIEAHAFYGCDNLTEVTIPSSVTNIGSSAFGGCTSLMEVTIPSSVTSIGSEAFYGCNLPTENNIRYAGTWAVGVTDKQQTSYTLRPNTTGLAFSLFKDCINMISIELPDGIKHIGTYMFYGCCDLTEITIPNSVISIEDYAFSDCTNLTNITIPNSVTSIGNYAFVNCN